jgi:hypothetical protein
MMALAGALAAPIALAQVPAPSPSKAAGGIRPVSNVPPLTPTAPTPTPTPTQATPPSGNKATSNQAGPLTNGGVFEKSEPAKKDGRVFEASTSLPAPTIPDQVPSATIALPADPIEPFLLTRQNGPFMVMAKTFRGPDAERWALALVLELRNDHGLPAYILRSRDFPMRSYIRTVPPTALRAQQQAHIGEPEKTRTYDEAVVLVGDEKTLIDSEKLLHKVKIIKPKCLNGNPSIFHWREGLNTAMRTTNPFVPAQDLYPRKPDLFVKEMNGGPHSIFSCPGRYTLQVAEFGGRATFNTKNPEFEETWWKTHLMEKSPLAEAADKAEELAQILAKDPEVRKTGALPYVYHDRTSSKVMLGAFNEPNDRAAVKLRETMLKLAVPVMQKQAEKKKEKTANMVIVPAPVLTDVAVLRAQSR